MPDLRRYIENNQEAGYREGTTARKASVLRSFLKFMGADLPDLGNTLFPTSAKSTPKTMPPDYIQRVLDQSKKDLSPTGMRDSALLHLLAGTGIRASEAARIDLDDLEPEAIRMAQRTVPTPAECRKQIDRYIQEARPKFLRNTPGQNALLINSRGKRLTRQWIFQTVRRMMGGHNATTETLRAHFALQKIGEQTPMEELRKMMGHNNIESTRRYQKTIIIPKTEK